MKTIELNPKEYRIFLEKSFFKSLASIFVSWAVILSCLMLFKYLPLWWLTPILMFVIAGRQLGLAILTHDASHGLLSNNMKLNNFLGQIVCGYSIFLNLKKYKKYHLDHHKFVGTDKDPDLGLSIAYPVSKKSFARKMIRDLLGITGMKRLIGIFLTELGLIEYTTTGQFKWSHRRIQWNGDFFGMIAFHFIIFVGLSLLSSISLYFLWMASYLTTFSFVFRVRSIAEHACMEQVPDEFKNTRTVMASWWERILFAPHYVNYHLEHHLMMKVPHYNLRKFHDYLIKKNLLKGSQFCQGYVQLLKLAVE